MKNLETANKGIKSLAKEEPALVEERFGYDVPGYMYGGIAKFQYGGPAGGYNIDQDYIRRYYEDILGMDVDDLGEEDSEEAMANALARAYGAPSEGIGSYARSMGYRDTTPGAPISIDAQDKTPDAYRFYPSEVSKIYAQAKGVPFSPLVAPPKEATFIDDLQPRRIASQLYAKDGTYVEANVEDFPERDELLQAPVVKEAIRYQQC